MKKLKILFVEDLPTDVEIAQRALNKENINFRHLTVETKAEFEKALKEFQPDLIISDYAMPKFDGTTALKITRSQPNYIPFIMLTGSMNEETAVACMKAGADDYVIKEKIRRLPFAVQEALQMDLVKKEKEQALQNLRRSEQKYHLLISSLTEGLMQVDNDDRILYVNQALCNMFGYTEEELIGRIGYDTLIYEEDKNLILARNKARLEIPEEKYEIRGKKKNGEIIWLSISGSALKDEQGRVIGSVGLLTDITEQKNAEEKLREEQQRLEYIMEVTKTHFNILDSDYNIKHIDSAWQKIYGDPEGKKCYQYFMDNSSPCPDCGVKKALNTKEVIVYEEFLPKENRFIEVHTIPFQDNQGKWLVAEFNIDITERIKTEQELRIKEKSIESSQSAIVLVDLNGRLTYVNRAFLKMWGYTDKKEVLGKQSVSFWISKQKAQEVVNNSLKNGKWEGELIAKRKDGSTFTALVSANLVLDDEGKPLLKMASFIDITDRKQAVEALRESEEKYRRITENISDVVWITDLNFDTTYISPSIYKLTGFTADEYLKMSLDKKHPPKSLLGFRNLFSQEIQKENDPAVDQNRTMVIEGEHYKADGSSIIISMHVSFIRDEGGNPIGIQGVTRDITERKQAESALSESERQFAFLAGTAFDLVKFTSIEHIYEYTARKLYELMEDQGIVAIVEYDTDSNLWKMKHIEGIHDKLDDLAKILGFDIHQLEGEISTKYYEKIISGKLEEIEFDFPGLFNNKISDKIGKTVKKLLSIDKMYCIAFQESEKILGNITLVTKKNAKPLKADLIEAFILQVTNFIKKQKSEEALRESEEKYRNLAENTSDLFAVMDLQGTITYISRSIEEETGFTRQEIEGTNIRKILTEQSAVLALKKVQERLSGTRRETPFEVDVRDKKGRIIPFELKTTSITENDRIIGFQIVARNITERKIAAAELEKSEKLFRTLFTDSLTPIFMVDENRCYINANQAALDFMECSKTELIGKSVYEHTPPDKLKQMQKEHADFSKNKTLETYYLINGKVKILLLEVSSLEMGDKTILVGIGQDITENKQAKQKIERSLAEKNLLLKELYHRTKNNMQVIASMLKMQARQIGGEKMMGYFQEIINRINSMASVHQKLYESKDLSVISLKDYIVQITHDLRRNYWKEGTNIEFAYDLQEVFVTIDAAIPLSLILTELVSNVFKHAFPNGGRGSIEIMLKADDEQNIFLELTDNGVGIAPDRDLRKAGSMGLETVFSLVEYQLDGNIEYSSQNGLKWHIVFRHDTSIVRV